MKRLIPLLFVFAAPAMADSIRTSDGITCSFDADETPFELRTYGETGSSDKAYNGDYWSKNNEDEFRAGVELTYRFGGPKRLDCDRLYQLELRSKEATVQELEAKVKALEAAQGIKWN